MDTGVSPDLEAVIAAHPGWMIGQNSKPPHRWEAIRRPRPSTELFIHASTLGELAAALDAEDLSPLDGLETRLRAEYPDVRIVRAPGGWQADGPGTGGLIRAATLDGLAARLAGDAS